jgi:hypothetical protein
MSWDVSSGNEGSLVNTGISSEGLMLKSRYQQGSQIPLLVFEEGIGPPAVFLAGLVSSHEPTFQPHIPEADTPEAEK